MIEIMNRVLFKSQSDNWKTPQAVYDGLNAEFCFDFDPCPLNPSPDVDGLTIEWGQSNFVNPPYSQISAWCKKSYEEALKGKTVVMLIPSRTDTKYWHNYIMKASEIRFIKGRLKFGDSKNSAPFPSAIIIYKIEK
jgi:site-specific DNA-methyltransferase (adenine-specific)